jgi:hypothetical protein
MDLSDVLTALKTERDRLNRAITTLEGGNSLTGRRGRPRNAGGKRRRMSAGARAKIAAAKRAWWAKRKRASRAKTSK